MMNDSGSRPLSDNLPKGVTIVTPLFFPFVSFSRPNYRDILFGIMS